MMKKWMSIMLTALLLFSSVIGATAKSAPRADVDGSGEMTLVDAEELFSAINGQITLTPYQIALADTDHNGELSLLDAQKAFYALNGKATLPETLPFEVRYVDVADEVCAYSSPDVITTNEEWQGFINGHVGIDPNVFTVSPVGEGKALITVPLIVHDSYVASVSAEDDTVFVSMVALSPADVEAIPHTAYAFVEVDAAVVQGRVVRRPTYMDASAVHKPAYAQAAVYEVRQIGADTGEWDPFAPLAFESVEECAAFAATHDESYAEFPLSSLERADVFASYDEAFFENYVLVRTTHTVNTSGYTPAPSGYVATADHLFVDVDLTVPFSTDAVLLGGETFAVYTPVAREDYVGQEIETFTRARTREDDPNYEAVSFEQVFYSEMPIVDYGSGEVREAMFVRSVAEAQALCKNAREDTAAFLGILSDAYFEDYALLFVRIQEVNIPNAITVESVTTNNGELIVTVHDEFGPWYLPALYHGCYFLQIAVSDLESVETVTCQVATTYVTDDAIADL